MKKVRVLPPLSLSRSLRSKTMWSPARPDWWGADWGHMFSTAVLLLLYYICSVLPLTINMFCIISWTLFLYLYYSIGFRACFSNRFWISHFSMRLLAAWPSHRWTRQWYIYHDVSLGNTLKLNQRNISEKFVLGMRKQWDRNKLKST